MGNGISLESEFRATYKLTHTIDDPVQRSIWTAAVSNTGRWVCLATGENLIRLWSLDLFKPVSIMAGHEDTIWALSYSPDDMYLVSSSADKTIRIWQPKLGQCVFVVRTPGQIAWSLSWHKAVEGRFAAGMTDGRITVYQILPAVDVNAPQLRGCDAVHVWQAHGKSVTALDWSNIDFDKIISTSDDSTIAIWTCKKIPTTNKLTTDCMIRVYGHIGCIVALALNPSDNHMLATSGEDCTIRVWDLRDTPPEILANFSTSESPGVFGTAKNPPFALKHHVVTGHEAKAKSLMFSWDGEILISAGEDATIRIWHFPGNRKLNSQMHRANSPAEISQLSVLQIHSAWVNGLSWIGSNSSFFLSFGGDGMVVGWAVPKNFWKNPEERQIRIPKKSRKDPTDQIVLFKKSHRK